MAGLLLVNELEHHLAAGFAFVILRVRLDAFGLGTLLRGDLNEAKTRLNQTIALRGDLEAKARAQIAKLNDSQPQPAGR